MILDISFVLIFSTCCPQAANDCDLEPVAYEFFTQAFVLYEEEVAVTAQLLFSSCVVEQISQPNVSDQVAYQSLVLTCILAIW